ncbi:retrovirus-related pol polyprotein from transposon TNT 1-94 [Tanacetum coccineum]
MMLLARVISQKFSISTNNRLRISSNTRNQAVVQDGRVDIQTKNASYGGNANTIAGRNRTQGFNVGDESNQIIQRVPRTESTPGKANVQCYNCNEKGHYARESQKPKAVSQVHASSKVLEQVSHGKRKTIIQTMDDDQIDSNIIFDDPFMENNGGMSEYDSTAHDEYQRRWLSDSQNELREFHKTDVIPMSRSLYKTLSETKEELIEEVQEMLNIFMTVEQKVNEKSPTDFLLQNEIDRLLEVSLTSKIRDCVLLSVEQQKHELFKVELEKSSSDSRDIQANLLKRIKILENDFQRS